MRVALDLAVTNRARLSIRIYLFYLIEDSLMASNTDVINAFSACWGSMNVDEIMDYFMTSETDDLDAAEVEIDGDYSQEEIALVRAKFISDVGN